MFIKVLSTTVLTLALPATGFAALTEVSKSFPNQSGPLSASAIMTAPAAAANYLLCATTTTLDGAGPPAAYLSWIDENRNRQTVAESTAGCTLIRNAANTTPTISVPAWNGSLFYNVYVWGLGFWPGGTQRQSGITETVNATLSPLQSSAELNGNSLIAVTNVSGTGTCSWTVGGVAGAGTAVFPIRIVGDVSFFNNSSACQETVVVLNFGVPAQGPGPLTDHEYNLLGWHDATYPYPRTVFTAGSAGANVLVAANIAEEPNGDKVSERLYVVGGNSIACARSAGSMGEPESCISAAFLPAGNAIVLETLNENGPQWGPSPPYSAEVDVIQF